MGRNSNYCQMSSMNAFYKQEKKIVLSEIQNENAKLYEQFQRERGNVWWLESEHYGI